MKIEKKVVEIETVTFDEADVEVVKNAYDIIVNLVGKLQDEKEFSDYETTAEENKILDLMEGIHREYSAYEDSYF